MNKKLRLKDEVRVLQAKLKAAETNFKDLVDYLTYKGVLEVNMEKMESWQDIVHYQREQEKAEREIAQAKELLKRTGHFVLKDKNELDAARLEKWINKHPK